MASFLRNKYLHQVAVGSKQVPLVVPARGLVLADRQPGGKHQIVHTLDDQPKVGFRWDLLKSTGSDLLNQNATAGMIVNNPVALTGYGQVLRGTVALTPLTEFNVGTGDWTMAWRVLWNSGASGYSNVFTIGYGGGLSLQVRIGDNGFGNRIQIGPNAATVNGNYALDVGRGSVAGIWQHLLFQRQAGKLTAYLGGTLHPMAVGTGSSYQQFISDSFSLSSISSVTLNQASDVYVAEFAFWDRAMHSSNFTPPVGSLFGS